MGFQSFGAVRPAGARVGCLVILKGLMSDEMDLLTKKLNVRPDQTRPACLVDYSFKDARQSCQGNPFNPGNNSNRRSRRRECPPQGLTALEPCLETPATPQTLFARVLSREREQVQHASPNRVPTTSQRLYDTSSSAVDAIPPCHSHCLRDTAG